jgi:hypothetical protein
MIPDLVYNVLTVIVGIGGLGGFVFMQIKGRIEAKRQRRITDQAFSRMKYRCLCDMRKVYD